MLTVVLAFVFAVLGGGLLGGGLRRYVALARIDTSEQAHRTAQRRLAAAAVGVGGIALIAPDSLALAITGAEGPGAATVALLVLYRLLVLGVLAASGLTLLLFSDPVTLRFRRTVAATRAALAGMPLVGRVVARPDTAAWRRAVGPGFPTTWDALLAHDAALTASFLAHQRHPDPARPALADLTEPATRAAAEAMLACDPLRTPTGPHGIPDVLDTEYGRAVARYQVALAAAEANATALAARQEGPALTLHLTTRPHPS